MKRLLTTVILMIVMCSSILAQNRYFIETTKFIEQILLDSVQQNKFNFRTNIIYDPPYNSSYLVGLDKKRYKSIADYDSILGIRNPFNRADIKKNKKDYYAALENYSYDDSSNQIRKYTTNDNKRIFEIKYWKQYMDSTGHITKHLSVNESDSLFNNEMDNNWEIFHSEFGDCFVSYQIPIFNIDFSYCYFEWSFACRQRNGKSFRGLYKKENRKWVQIRLEEIWTNDLKNNR